MSSQQPPTHLEDSVDSNVPGASDSSTIYGEPEEAPEGQSHDLTEQKTQAGSLSHDNDPQSIREQIASATNSSVLPDQTSVATAHNDKTADTAIRTDAATASAQDSTDVSTNNTCKTRKGGSPPPPFVLKASKQPKTYIDYVATQRDPRRKIRRL